MQEQYLSAATLDWISNIIQEQGYKRVVLQLPRVMLPISFHVTSALRTKEQHKPQQKQAQFYTLYDSNKKQCCTDIIGASHIQGYSCIFHFGYACFSEHYAINHHYILPHCPAKQWNRIEALLSDKDILKQIKNKQINLVLYHQSLQYKVSQIKQLLKQHAGIQVAKLPFQKLQNDAYFGFSFYTSSVFKNYNVLVIQPDSSAQGTESMPSDLLQNLYLSKSSLSITSIHTLSPDAGLTAYEPSTNKGLMQRLSQISQLSQHTRFGILVSNPCTQFCGAQVKRMRELLSSRKLKHFTFMMNNINECKLGNFPEIQVYIIIACYNYSLYSIKDFYRLVVTPYDIEVAFGDSSYETYRFDLNTAISHQKGNQSTTQEESSGDNSNPILKQKVATSESSLQLPNNQIALQNIVQTLDFYRDREYKGLIFADKKEVEKVRLGKIGIAAQYHPIMQNETKQIISQSEGQQNKN